MPTFRPPRRGFSSDKRARMARPTGAPERASTSLTGLDANPHCPKNPAIPYALRTPERNFSAPARPAQQAGHGGRGGEVINPQEATSAGLWLREGKQMATGVVKWFNDAKGYGFITP